MDRTTGYNSTFAIGGVSCSADSYVQAESSVLQMIPIAIGISRKNPALRVAANR